MPDEGIKKADPSHRSGENLLNVIRRIEGDPMPHAKVHVHVGGSSHELVADEEGFVREWIKLPEPLDVNQSHDVRLELIGTAAGKRIHGAASVLVPSTAARFGVVRD